MEANKTTVITIGTVMKEAKEKFPGLSEEVMLNEFIDLQRAVQHQATNLKMSDIAVAKSLVAISLLQIYTVRKN